MDVLQKEIDEVYATHPTAHEALDNGIVEQHQQFVRSLTEVNGGCAVISDLSNRKSYVTVHPWANFLGLTPEEAALSVIDSMDEDCIYRRIIRKIGRKAFDGIQAFPEDLFPCLPANG